MRAGSVPGTLPVSHGSDRVASRDLSALTEVPNPVPSGAEDAPSQARAGRCNQCTSVASATRGRSPSACEPRRDLHSPASPSPTLFRDADQQPTVLECAASPSQTEGTRANCGLPDSCTLSQSTMPGAHSRANFELPSSSSSSAASPLSELLASVAPVACEPPAALPAFDGMLHATPSPQPGVSDASAAPGAAAQYADQGQSRQRFACMPPSLGGKAQPGQLYARNAQRYPAAFSPAGAPCATLTPHGEVPAQSPSSSNPSSQGLPMQTGQDIIDMNSRLVGQMAQQQQRSPCTGETRPREHALALSAWRIVCTALTR